MSVFIKAPLLLWGPYLWANGTIPRSDGLSWLREDFYVDGVHPSDKGAKKVASLLLDFLRTNELASIWYLGPPYATTDSEPKPLEPSSEDQGYEEPRPIDEETGEPVKEKPQPK